MKRNTLIALCIAVAFSLLGGSACQTETAESYCRAYAEDMDEGSLPVLPFQDGAFIIAASDISEGRWFELRFSEGDEVNYDRRRGIYYGIFYTAFPHAAEFIGIMNGLSPVYIDSIINDFNDDRPPFGGIGHDDHLYSIMVNGVPNWTYVHEIGEFRNFHFRMRVYETGECGLLYFYMFGSDYVQYPTHTHLLMSDIMHHSLYRITLDELSELIQYAESLERSGREWHGHVTRQYRLLNLYLVPAIVSFCIIACASSLLIIRKHRKAKKTQNSEQK